MRKTIVYVLRLLVDYSEPDQMRGILRDVLTGQEQSFINGQGLLDLLHSQRNIHNEIAGTNRVCTPAGDDA